MAKSGSVGLKNPPRRTSSGLGGSQCSKPSEQQSALVVEFQANALTTVPFGSTADDASASSGFVGALTSAEQDVAALTQTATV